MSRTPVVASAIENWIGCGGRSEGYFGGFVPLNADVETLFGVGYALALEVVVEDGGIGVVGFHGFYAGGGRRG